MQAQTLQSGTELMMHNNIWIQRGIQIMSYRGMEDAKLN